MFSVRVVAEFSTWVISRKAIKTAGDRLKFAHDLQTMEVLQVIS